MHGVSADQLASLAADALWLALLLAAPTLLVTWLVSLAGSALASVTQLQDSALSAIPRVAAGLITLWLTGAWMGDRLTRFATDVLRLVSGAAS